MKNLELIFLHSLVYLPTSNSHFDRVEVGDLKSQIRKSEQQDRRDLIIITSSAGSVKDLPLDGIKIFTSEFVINSILNCNIDFENNIHSLMQKMSVSGKRVI